MTTATLILLCSAAFGAGFIDAIAGGGGLVQLPALLALMPAAPIPLLFGTNKFSSACGTGVALWRYTRSLRIPWPIVLPAAGFCLVCSAGGAWLLTLLPADRLRPVVFVLLVAIALYSFGHRSLGAMAPWRLSPRASRYALWTAGSAIGFYDGFFGPGTGQFLIVALVAIAGLDFLHATASAKVLNLATNLAAVAYFASQGDIIYRAGIPMAACNILGGWLGAHTAILKGSLFIRRVFLGMVLLLIAKLAWDLRR